MKNVSGRITISLIAVLSAFVFTSCSAVSSDTQPADEVMTATEEGALGITANASVNSAVDFDHELNEYKPKKDNYNFYFTYKIVHPWWDAVALGMEDA